MEWLTKAEMRKLKKGNLMDLDTGVEINGVLDTVGNHLFTDTYTFREWFNQQIANKRYFTRSTYFYIKKILADETNYVKPVQPPPLVKTTWYQRIYRFFWGSK